MPYKRPGSPNYYTCLTIGGRQIRRSTGTTNRREAERIEKAWKKEARSNRHPWEDVMAQYLIGRPNERSSYAVTAMRPFFSRFYVQDIAPGDINSYKRQRQSDGIAESTIHKELTVFRAALRYCNHELGWDVPTELLRGRLPKLRDNSVRWLTKAEYQTLMASARKNRRAQWLPDFIALAVRTGLRHRELLGLTWDRVDLDNGLLYLRPQDQKGARTSSVPLSETAVEILSARKAANEAKPKFSQSAYVIYRTGGAKIDNARKSFQRAVADAEIPDLRIHDLRHTCAAWMVQHGVPLRTVSEVLRHRDIATTMMYAHLAPEAVRDAVRALDD